MYIVFIGKGFDHAVVSEVDNDDPDKENTSDSDGKGVTQTWGSTSMVAKDNINW